MFNSNGSGILQTNKHNMFICPNNNSYIDLANESSMDNILYYEFEDALRDNILETFSLDNSEEEVDFHYNLMNRKVFNPYPDNIEDIFVDEIHYPQNFQSQVTRIIRKIETSSPDIFRFLNAKGIPYPVARRLVRKIIVLTLNYNRCKL